jgi:hypothetical protein
MIVMIPPKNSNLQSIAFTEMGPSYHQNHKN